MKVMLMMVTVLLVATIAAVVNSQTDQQCHKSVETNGKELLNCLRRLTASENLSPSTITTFCDSSCTSTLENFSIRCNIPSTTAAIQSLCSPEAKCYIDRAYNDPDLTRCSGSITSISGNTMYCSSCKSTVENATTQCNFTQGTTILQQLCSPEAQCLANSAINDQGLKRCYESIINSGPTAYCSSSCKSTVENAINRCKYKQGAIEYQQTCTIIGGNNGGITSSGSGAMMVVLTLASLVAVILCAF